MNRRKWVRVGAVRFCGFVRQTTKAEKENKRHTAQATKSDVPRMRTMEMAMAMATCLPPDRKKVGENGKGQMLSSGESTDKKSYNPLQVIMTKK